MQNGRVFLGCIDFIDASVAAIVKPCPQTLVEWLDKAREHWPKLSIFRKIMENICIVFIVCISYKNMV